MDKMKHANALKEILYSNKPQEPKLVFKISNIATSERNTEKNF